MSEIKPDSSQDYNLSFLPNPLAIAVAENRIIRWVVSLVIIVLVMYLNYRRIPTDLAVPQWVSYLPHWNALCNLLTLTFLAFAVSAIRKRARFESNIGVQMALVRRHVFLIFSSLGTSILFLAGYLTQHYYIGDFKYETESVFLKTIYLTILITHILGSVALVPLMVRTLASAGACRWGEHRKLVRLTTPLWMYVSITGILIYLFLQLGV